jgi:internalin A
LLRQLSVLVQDQCTRMGAQPLIGPPADRSTLPSERAADDGHTLPELTFSQELGTESQYFLSYARGDDTPEGRQREAIVNQLCEAAEQRGLVILRDERVLGLGDSISKFMQRLAGGDRIFVILSDKYLRSPYCMYELLEIWRKCSGEEQKFLDRIRVYVIPGTRVFSVSDRAQYAIFWQQEYEKVHQLIHDHGLTWLARGGSRNINLWEISAVGLRRFWRRLPIACSLVALMTSRNMVLASWCPAGTGRPLNAVIGYRLKPTSASGGNYSLYPRRAPRQGRERKGMAGS